MKTIITARFTEPGTTNYTERRVLFDGNLDERVAALVGYGLLWDLGCAPVSECADVEIERREGTIARVDPESFRLRDAGQAAVTVDTSLCSFSDAIREALRLAQAGYHVWLTHGIAIIPVAKSDTAEAVEKTWRDTVAAVVKQREATRDDGRAALASQLRAAGFRSATWSLDAELSTVTLDNADAAAILERMRPERSDVLITERDDARREHVKLVHATWHGDGEPSLCEHAERLYPGEGRQLFPDEPIGGDWVEIVDRDRPGDPPIGKRLQVVRATSDAVFVAWGRDGWPMCRTSVRLCESSS